MHMSVPSYNVLCHSTVQKSHKQQTSEALWHAMSMEINANQTSKCNCNSRMYVQACMHVSAGKEFEFQFSQEVSMKMYSVCKALFNLNMARGDIERLLHSTSNCHDIATIVLCMLGNFQCGSGMCSKR